MSALPGDLIIEVEKPDGAAVMTGSLRLADILRTPRIPLGTVVYAGPVAEVPGGLDAMIGTGARFGLDWLTPCLVSLSVADLRREMTGIGARLPAILAMAPGKFAVWEFPLVDRVWWFWLQPLGSAHG